ncbi:ABC transporter G family member 24 [Linum perenne]
MRSFNFGGLILVWVVAVLSFQCFMGECQDMGIGGDYSAYAADPSLRTLMAEYVYNKMSNLTANITRALGNQASFCMKDPDADWDRAFNFSSNLDFLSNCILQTGGDMMQRICSESEMKFYFNTLLETDETRKKKGANYLRPNLNCNLTSWVSGCEPGWACSVGGTQPVDLQNSHIIPPRTSKCQTCCEGFFCPHGLTCMIPCPLGSYCPHATLNKATAVCEPYNYQLPPGNPNHTCGGANTWADITTSSEIFCAAGSYCPTTIQQNACSNGHFCRMGATSETRCFKLTSCDSKTTTQNIHAYGVMVIYLSEYLTEVDASILLLLQVALSTVLLMIYNCSDQVLAIRERRLAKSREAAAVSARETAKARQRWKSATGAARKRAGGLQAQLSQTFSRKKYAAPTEQLTVMNQAKPNDNDGYSTDRSSVPRGSPPSTPGIRKEHSRAPSSQKSSTSYAASPSSMPEGGETKEHSHRVHSILELDMDFDSQDTSIIDMEDEDPKGHRQKKDKDLSTDSQIFKYAYSQLEREKAMQQQNKNLTFSGVVKMAAGHEVKKRPLIEISFKDLTLTLKNQKKHLLRCVTGKIKPGRITAVMGPSGAGKTTFLSALAGKAVGCSISGVILINGKPKSIHSYKRIIGFVPQDDIVHGNLTVEENLWFSAHCRLSADLPKAEKVLIVERAIESLGLQGVRNSVVGTVEKRGISGGQRKRVNVGLEMVMEPSLLLLDEPTSGLDSASSQLLLRALRREALEGVNILMVVHQPSYSLFKMFDDLVLLAKGGLTVYHGPVVKVEEYFDGLGINVPDRVNPPDHYIDILEGIVKPSASSVANYTDLPLKWMMNKGYHIPPDMKESSPGLLMPQLNRIPSVVQLGDGDEDQSFAGELWEDVKSNVELRRDRIVRNFLKPRDLSNRRTPGVWTQSRYYLGRVFKQRLREAKMQAVDLLILFLAGACLGSLGKANDRNMGSAGYSHTIIAVSLLCKIAALRSFSLDRLQYWRESGSGMSSLAYFLAKDTVDHFNTAIKPVVYLSMFYFFTNPRSSFADNYIVLLCLVYCVTGIAYALAIFFAAGPAQLWSVLLPVVLTLIATQQRPSKILRFISNFCYPRWALEAFVIANAERYDGVWLLTRCGALMNSGYNVHDWLFCICVLLLFGFVARIVAFFGLLTVGRRR